MNRLITPRSLRLALFSVFTGLFAASTVAQTALHVPAQSNRVAAHADFGPQTQLSGHIPGWVNAGNQVLSRSVDLGSPLRIAIVLRRDPAVQAAFVQLLADQQNPGSPQYHQWLTPQEVGSYFGPTAADIAAVKTWLGAQGLKFETLSPSGMILEASGPVSAVGNAFRTSFGYFTLEGQPRLSAVSEPYIPSALVPVIDSVHGLTEIPLKPMSHHSAPQSRPVAQGSGPKPLFTNTNGTSTSYFLVPDDYAVIYDINSVYNGGNKGGTIGSKTGHVAIIGRSRVAATDISEWASNVALGSYNLNTIIPTTGTDPGATCTFANASTCKTGGDQGEQTLDVDRVIGTAPAVQADLVVSLSSQTLDGIYISASYNVNTVVDPVMTISYGACESSAGSSGVNLWDTLFSTGAAEGISTFVSSGDSGANACAADGTATTTTRAASINYICSSSYDTCVGGTEFNDSSSYSTYWSATNGTGMESAKSYIPEGGWNESNGGAGDYTPLASGGGPSAYVAKPSWQTGTGVPADNARDTPDVAFPAAEHDGIYTCLDFELGLYTSQGITSADNCTAAGGGYFFGDGGTSAAAPTMAGVTALLNTKLGVAQGNLNPLLYKLAAGSSGSTVFHDVTVTTSGVSSCLVTTPSMCNNSTPGSSSNSTTVAGGVQGYLVGTGYDEVTGLGSIDVANLLTAASSVSAATFTVTPATTSYTLTAGATTGNTDTITVASSGGFAGTVALTCTVTNVSGTAAGSCSLSPTSTALTSGGSGTSTLTINTTAGTSGTLSVTVTGTSGSTVVTSSKISVTVSSSSPAASITLSQPTSLNFTSGATSGNTTTSTLTSVAFAGTVTMGCTISSGGYYPPTCSVSPASPTLTSGGTSAETITISSTVAHARQGAPQQAGLAAWGVRAGVLLAALLCLVPFRRRRLIRPLAAFALLALGLTAVSGCGGSNPSTSSGGGTTTHSSAGTYTVTVTATSGSVTATPVTFSLTIN
jgi:subtilase family serine protease